MKIKGSCSQIEKLLSQKQHILCKPRFKKALEYFRRLENILEVFEIYSEEPSEPSKQVSKSSCDDSQRDSSESTPRSNQFI